MHELIYTSASKGLTSGSRGFCTVAATKSMAKSLSKKLEGLSGYNHVYDPGNSNNPVNFSFVTLKDSRQTHYVLSRICDAGLDYTQRSNKFAHHIALAKSELPSAGPAWALQSSGSFKVAWGDAQTPYHIDDSSFPDGNVATAVCTSWQSLLGDAGYGGIIAGQLADRAIKDMVIAYELGTDILGLISESLAIIPHNKRWQATFSTFAGKPNANYTCKLRCVLVGSEEAQKAAGNKRVRFLDLTNPAPIEHENEYVVAARNGQIAQPDVAPTPVEQPKRWVEETPVDDGLQQVTQVPSILSTDDVDLVEPEPTVSRPTSIFDDSYEAGGIAPPPLPRQGGRGFGRIVVGLSAMALLMLVLCGGGGGAYYYVLTQRSARPDVDDLIARNPTKVDKDGGKSENKPDKGDGKPDKGDGKPDKGDDKPDKGDDKPDKGDDKPAMDKAAMEKAAMEKAAADKLEIEEIKNEFDTAKSKLTKILDDSKELKEISTGDYAFIPYMGLLSAQQITESTVKLQGGTFEAGTALQDKFATLRKQSFEPGGLPTGAPGAAEIVKEIATSLLDQYRSDHDELILGLEPAADHVQLLKAVEGLLNTSRAEFNQLLERVKKVDPKKAPELKVQITAETKFIAGILKTNQGKKLQDAVAKAQTVPEPAEMQKAIESSLQADKSHKLIVEMFDGNPLTKDAGFIPAEKIYNLATNQLYANMAPRKEIKLPPGAFEGPKLLTWLKHFATHATAKQVPTNIDKDKTNIYPICWLGIAMGKTPTDRLKSEVKFKRQDNKYIATLNGGPIDIVVEINTIEEKRDYEFYRLYVAPKKGGDGEALKNNLLTLGTNKGLYITYGRPGAAKLQESQVVFRDQDAVKTSADPGQSPNGQPSTSSVTSGILPKGYMLVTSDKKPARISTGQKLQWRVNSGEWTETTGEAPKRQDVKLPMNKIRQVDAINLSAPDAKKLLLVLHSSQWIVQGEAFEYDDADFNSYLLWKLIQGTPHLLDSFRNSNNSFIEYIKTTLKPESLPKPIAGYLNELTFNKSFEQALRVDEINMSSVVLKGGYDALVTNAFNTHTSWWDNFYIKQDEAVRTKKIPILNNVTYLQIFKASDGITYNDVYKKIVKHSQVNVRNFNPQQQRAHQLAGNELIRDRGNKLRQLRKKWGENFTNYYIAKLQTDIESKLSQSNSSNLFTKKREMIKSFELQVLNSEGEPLEPIYKLALTDP